MTYRGHVKNGQILLDEPVSLPEGAEVQVELLKNGDIQATIWEQLLDLAGTVEGLPSDMAENHDHYLYGTPKKDMSEVFADTHYFIALLSPGDSAYGKARAATVGQTATLVTTAWILTELAGALSKRRFRKHFLRTLERLRANPAVIIIEPDSALFEAGINLYAARDDKDWSLTDCISFVVMEQRGITEALTGDQHFQQAGFQTLLK